MLADVEKSVKAAILCPGHNDGFRLELKYEKVTRFLDILDNSGDQPCPGPDLIPFPLQVVMGDIAFSGNGLEGDR